MASDQLRPEAPPTVEGICVLGELSPEFEVTDPVEDTRISGFEIRGFSGNGIFALATEDLRASRNRTKDNVEYGIFVLLSTRPVLADNKASGNGVAGLYVGGNQDVDAKIFGNTTWDAPRQPTQERVKLPTGRSAEPQLGRHRLVNAEDIVLRQLDLVETRPLCANIEALGIAERDAVDLNH